MFSNNYKAVFELLGNEEIKAEILVNLPPKFEYLTEFGECDQSSLEGPLRGKNSNSSFSLQMAKAQTSMYDAGKAKRITIKHTVHRATDKQTGLVFDFKEEGNTWPRRSAIRFETPRHPNAHRERTPTRTACSFDKTAWHRRRAFEIRARYLWAEKRRDHCRR